MKKTNCNTLSDIDILRAENRELLSEVTRLRRNALTEERVRPLGFRGEKSATMHPNPRGRT